MYRVRRLKGCPRCGGDLFEEPVTERWEDIASYISCLQCGELRFEAMPPIVVKREELRGRPGRPRKVAAV